MRYSVYDYTRRAYDYYEAPGPGGTHAGSPPKPRAVGDIGAPPDRASWKLPIGARKIGTGEMPVGRIASLGGTDALSSPNVLLYAAAALLIWRFWR
jgi:hypothetical protein